MRSAYLLALLLASTATSAAPTPTPTQIADAELACREGAMMVGYLAYDTRHGAPVERSISQLGLPSDARVAALYRDHLAQVRAEPADLLRLPHHATALFMGRCMVSLLIP